MQPRTDRCESPAFPPVAQRCTAGITMKVGQIDLRRGGIRLAAETTKNDEGRTVIMTNEARGLLAECVRGKARLGKLVAGKWTGPRSPSISGPERGTCGYSRSCCNGGQRAQNTGRL